MTDKKLLAAKVSSEFHDDAHNAAKQLDTTVAALIKAALSKAIRKAARGKA